MNVKINPLFPSCFNLFRPRFRQIADILDCAYDDTIFSYETAAYIQLLFKKNEYEKIEKVLIAHLQSPLMFNL